MHARVHAGWLLVLTGLFLLRVAAQPLALTGMPGVPAFDVWHSGALPYGLLFLSQLAILIALLDLAWRLWTGRVTPRRGVGTALLAAGTIYFGVMVARLAVGATILRGHSWFDRPLPTIFHMVLAGCLLVYGHFHFTMVRLKAPAFARSAPARPRRSLGGGGDTTTEGTAR
jgi:hypothetical protein